VARYQPKKERRRAASLALASRGRSCKDRICDFISYSTRKCRCAAAARPCDVISGGDGCEESPAHIAAAAHDEGGRLHHASRVDAAHGTLAAASDQGGKRVVVVVVIASARATAAAAV